MVIWALWMGLLGTVDVVPGEEGAPWEHWEGAHGGSCKFGCSVAMHADDAPSAQLLAGALLVGWLGVRRARSRSPR